MPQARADHRSAPTIDNYSAININDVYLFRDPPCTTANCTSPKLVVALSTQAVADPLFGSSYHFQENALYQLNFTTTPDARPTAQIDFVFGPFRAVSGPSLISAISDLTTRSISRSIRKACAKSIGWVTPRSIPR
jgi:hypothetical protein